jgi:UDP-N-acetyl-D-mannosaminuronic acid dehydrogenase
MAFKAESDDKRESLSYKLKKLLELEAKAVICSDEYIKEKGFVSPKELLERADIVVIAAPHKAYRNLDYHGKILVDIWNEVPRNGEK